MLIEAAKMQKGRELPDPSGWRRVHRVVQPRVYVYNVELRRSGDEYWPPTTPGVFEVACSYGRKGGTLRHKRVCEWQTYEAAVVTFYAEIERLRKKGYDGYPIAAN